MAISHTRRCGSIAPHQAAPKRAVCSYTCHQSGGRGPTSYISCVVVHGYDRLPVFRVVPVLSKEDAVRFTHVDYENRMAMVATVGDGADESIVAVVRYDRTDAESAEVAFVVADDWQGLGIAPAILCDLAAYARKRGISRLVAITMGSNMHMLDLLRHCGFPVTMRYVDGDVEGTLDITDPPSR